MLGSDPIIDWSTDQSHQEAWLLTHVTRAQHALAHVCLTVDHVHKCPLFPVDRYIDGQTDGWTEKCQMITVTLQLHFVTRVNDLQLYSQSNNETIPVFIYVYFLADTTEPAC